MRLRLQLALLLAGPLVVTGQSCADGFAIAGRDYFSMHPLPEGEQRAAIVHHSGVQKMVIAINLEPDNAEQALWILPVPGHKDSIVADKASDRICRELRMPAVVTAGIHVDNATAGQIADIEAACVLLSDRLIAWAAAVEK